MIQVVRQPPDEPPEADGAVVAGWWRSVEGGTAKAPRVQCDLCPRQCVLPVGARGYCFVRENRGGRLVSTTYGRSTGFCIDPIEKKPLFHFYPGTGVLSFGTPGCNLGCRFCQNWTITRSRRLIDVCKRADPAAIAEAAEAHGCRSVAFTYNDPIIWAEYAIDTARACRQRGIAAVAVTSGYIAAEACADLFAVIDAANIDLKGFSDDFYRTYCGGRLQPVLDTLRYVSRSTDCHLEITHLVIPGANDDRRQWQEMFQWIAAELRPDVPLHLTAFHPDFELTDRPATEPELLFEARALAIEAGLNYVYTGNIFDPENQNTYCPGCGRMVIERRGYQLGAFELDSGRCRFCGAAIAGRFASLPGDWGGRRVPIEIDVP